MSYVVIADPVPVLTPGPARESVIDIKVNTVQIRSDLKQLFWLNQDLFYFQVNDLVFKKYTPQITSFILKFLP